MIRLALAALFAVAVEATAGSVTFADVCSGYVLKMPVNDLLIYCPGQTEPWMTIPNFRLCPTRRAQLLANGVLKLTC